MQTTTSFEHLIKEKFNGLSAAQKKVAEYLLQNMEKAAFSTVVQIGREVDVSDTTVIRLSYALGFSGFSEMQERIQQHILQSANPANSLHQTVQAVTADDPNPFAKSIQNDMSILSQTINQLNVAELWRTVDALIDADQVLVVGYRASYAVAYWASYLLGTMRPNVHLLPFTGDMYEKLYQLTDKSAVLAISVPRYAKETLLIAENAKKQGATLISATDRILSPVGRISDIVLTANVSADMKSGVPSISAMFSLLLPVIMGVMMKDEKRVKVRHQGLEQFYTSNDIFVE